jgi:hypothetical protein
MKAPLRNGTYVSILVVFRSGALVIAITAFGVPRLLPHGIGIPRPGSRTR